MKNAITILATSAALALSGCGLLDPINPDDALVSLCQARLASDAELVPEHDQKIRKACAAIVAASEQE